MHIDAFLADSVAKADNKLFVHGGGWNILRARALPARQSRIGLAAVITVGYTETGDHTFTVRLEDADANRLPLSPDRPELAGNFHVGRPAELTDGDEQVVPLAINLDGLVFPQAGRYRFVITVNGQLMNHLPFQVVHQPA